MAPWLLPSELTIAIMKCVAFEARKQLPELATVCAAWRAVVGSIVFRRIRKEYEKDDDLELLHSNLLSRADNFHHLRRLDLSFYSSDTKRCEFVVEGVMRLLSSLDEEADARNHPGISLRLFFIGPNLQHYAPTSPDADLRVSLPKVRLIKKLIITAQGTASDTAALLAKLLGSVPSASKKRADLFLRNGEWFGECIHQCMGKRFPS